jgi:hypothetical protein
VNIFALPSGDPGYKYPDKIIPFGVLLVSSVKTGVLA